jgi:hypothetical protein
MKITSVRPSYTIWRHMPIGWQSCKGIGIA